jgi:hypothetical protein
MKLAWWLTPVAALVVFAAGMWLQSRRTPATAVWTGVQLGGSKVAVSPRLSPDGRTLAFTALVDGQMQVAVMHPGSANWTVLTHQKNKGAVWAICWSHDSTKIYYSRGDSVPRGVFSVPALGGEERLILEDAQSPELLPDGSFVIGRINAARAVQMFRYWPETGRLDPMTGFLWQNSAFTFADGKEVIFFGQAPKPEPPQRFYALDVVSGKARRLPPDLPPTSLDLIVPHAIGIEPGGRSFLTAIQAGDLYRIVRVFRDGSGLAETGLSVSFPASAIDVGADGSLYMDQMDQPLGVLRFSPTGGSAEALIGGVEELTVAWDVLVLPDGRMLFPTAVAGRTRLMVASPGRDAVPFVESEEETSSPVAPVGDKKVALIVGTGADRILAIASLDDGRIERRLASTRGAEIYTSLGSSPDGKTLYYTAGSPGTVWSISTEGGEPKKIASADQMAVDPDGQHLVLARGEKEDIKLSRLALGGGPEVAIPFNSEYSL